MAPAVSPVRGQQFGQTQTGGQIIRIGGEILLPCVDGFVLAAFQTGQQQAEIVARGESSDGFFCRASR